MDSVGGWADLAALLACVGCLTRLAIRAHLTASLRQFRQRRALSTFAVTGVLLSTLASLRTEALARRTAFTDRSERPRFLRAVGDVAPPWSGEGLPPPRPLGRTEAEPEPAEPSKAGAGRQVVVREGDSLWSIASRVLRTDDDCRIARAWRLIHRANRAVIGSNPHLIHPGQLLHITEEGLR